MHWSKSHHAIYLECPRRFFYGAVAGPRNPEIRALEERDAPPLVRHNIVRKIINSIVQEKTWSKKQTEAILEECDTHVSKVIRDELEANAQASIVKACVSTFCKEVLASVQSARIVTLAADTPTEFVYDKLSIMVLPEMVIDCGDHVDVLTFRTGSSDWRSDDEFRLRAGGLTCWARSVLKIVDRPVTVREVFLRDGFEEHPLTLSDDDVRAFIGNAKSVRAKYAASAKIRDFPAKPERQTCRFCPYKTICPEWKDFEEHDYGIAALKSTVLTGEVGPDTEVASRERKQFYLCHASEDKEALVRPLARAMEAAGLSYWLDEAELHWGDSLIGGVNKGLQTSDYLICFITEAFVDRGWPEQELNSALSKQIPEHGKRVLPLLVVDKAVVDREYPILSDIVYQKWSDGLPAILRELQKLA